MNLPDLENLSHSARTLTIFKWIQTVSQHPPAAEYSMTGEVGNPSLIGSDDEGPTVQTVVPETRSRAAKRVRAESDLTPLIGMFFSVSTRDLLFYSRLIYVYILLERVRVSSTRRGETPFTDVSSTRAPTPTPCDSAMETASVAPSKSSNAGGSSVRGRRDMTRERRLLMDPEHELG
jgi:hypothetical protein